MKSPHRNPVLVNFLSSLKVKFRSWWQTRGISLRRRRNPLRRQKRLASSISACEVLEDRTVLAVGFLDPGISAVELFNVQIPSAIGTDANGVVYVNADSSDFFNPGTFLQGFDPSTGQPLTQQTFVSGTTLLADNNGGAITPLSAEVAANLNLPLGFQNGDLLNLLPNGRLVQVRPSQGLWADFGNLKQNLVSASTGSPVANVDNVNILDASSAVATGVFGPMAGGIIPEATETIYNDLAAFAVDDVSTLLVSGNSFGLPFVMRLSFDSGQFLGGKVLVASRATTGGNISLPGVDVNQSGMVLTTLPTLSHENFINGNQNAGVEVPVGFDILFDSPLQEQEPFLPFGLDPVLQQGTPLFNSVASTGITTDSRGNFLVTSDQVATVGTFLVTSDLFLRTYNDLLFVPMFNPNTGAPIGNELITQFDIAVSPDDNFLFSATTLSGTLAGSGISDHQVLRATFPSLPDLTPLATPGGWESSVVVSSQTGTHSNDTNLTTADQIFVDVSVLNQLVSSITANATFAPFMVNVLLDDPDDPNDSLIPIATKDITDPIAVGGFATFNDIPVGNLSEGNYRITVQVDPLAQQPETNESNNVAVATFSVESPSPPNISISDPTMTEGDEGTTNVIFDVTLDRVSTDPMTVDFATSDGSATAGIDYTSTNGTLTFDPDETSKTVTVDVIGDTLNEFDETFLVNLTNVSNAVLADSQGVGTITDNDPAPTLSIDDVTVTEGDSGTVDTVFTVSLSAESGKPVTVEFATANDSATAGSDYTSSDGMLTFDPGVTSQTVTVSVLGDTEDEPNETFFVDLSSPTNATIADGQGIGTIEDDDESISPLIVTNTNDSGLGSLRNAIDFANSNPGPDEITFNIPETDPAFVDVDFGMEGGDADPDAFVIQVHSDLPSLTDDGTTIDGRTQTTFGGDTNPFGPEIVLDGSMAGSGVNGLTLISNENHVFGLDVQQFSASGIAIQGGDNNWVAGNYIGTDATGTEARGNSGIGVFVVSGAQRTLIGTNADGVADDAERNLISGNANDGIRLFRSTTTDNVVAGNYIGTDRTGTTKLPNGIIGVRIQGSSNSNRIGTNGDGVFDLAERNVISGNTRYGIAISGAGTDNNIVAGNYIGTDASGTVALANSADGVVINSGAQFNRIGTDGDGVADAAERNVISGNGDAGVDITGAGTDSNVVAGNYIGTDVSGVADLGNSYSGVAIHGGAQFNLIGSNGDGTGDVAERNLISGNRHDGVTIFNAGTDHNVVAGNDIGTDVTGDMLIPNVFSGVAILNGTKSNRVGTDGSDDAFNSHERNVIAGSGDGVYVRGASDTVIAGNFIGTNTNGDTALPNTGNGIIILGGASNTRIGTDGDGIADDAEGNLISGNGGPGVNITRSGTEENTIAGNFIGTDVTGTAALGNSQDGVLITGGAESNLIGTDGDGTADAVERNLISGNGRDGVRINADGTNQNIVAGNFIGTDATGTVAVGNEFRGMTVNFGAQRNLIGTNGDGVSDAAERNIISGNAFDGIFLFGAQENVIAGNYIGTDITGTAALGNEWGVTVFSSNGNLIGTDGDGTADSDERNLISGNASSGVEIRGSGSVENVVAGNFIGTDVTGTEALANGGQGVQISDGASNNLIGTDGDGTADQSERNIISGNAGNGVEINGVQVTNLSIVDQMIAGTLPSSTATATIDQADLHDATLAPASTNWSFDNPIPGGGGDDYAVVSTGALQVNAAGTYTFALSGDDGGRLRIDGEDVIVDDSLHGFQNRFGEATLTAGSHTFEWVGFERAGGAGFELSVAVGSSQSGPVTEENGWKVFGDPSPHAEIALDGQISAITYYLEPVALHNVVAGNYIGTDVTGTVALANTGRAGVRIQSGASNNLIGTDGDGTADAAERNVVSGNSGNGIEVAFDGADDNVIAGNYVGVDATGANPLGNGNFGVFVNRGAQNTIIGTDGDGIADEAEGNVISANASRGVLIFGEGSDHNVIAGNFIGTDADGMTALGNGLSGVVIRFGAQFNRIGTDGDGTGDVAERNVISGNVHRGVLIFNAGTEHNIVAGNFIGTNATGTAAIGNTDNGVWLANFSDAGPANNNVIGTNGDGMGDEAEGNLISGNGDAGIRLSGVDENAIAGNLIGTDINGTSALGNNGSGLVVGGVNNVIGTDGDGIGDAEERNIISGNAGNGVRITGADTENNTVAGNYIGTDVTGTEALGNGLHGIELSRGASFNVIGTDGDGVGDEAERNVISGNSSHGIDITGIGTDENIVAGNYIGTNKDANNPSLNDGLAWYKAEENANDEIAMDANGVLRNGAAFAPGKVGQAFSLDGVDDFVELPNDLINTPDSITVEFWFNTTETESNRLLASVEGAYGFYINRFSTNGGILPFFDGRSGDAAEVGDFGSELNDGEWHHVAATNDGALTRIYIDGSYAGSKEEELFDIDSLSRNSAIGSQYNGIRPSSGLIDEFTIYQRELSPEQIQSIYDAGSAGKQDFANQGNGVNISGGSQGNTIGTDGDGMGDEAERNVISGNQSNGVQVWGSDSTENWIAGNYIGTDVTGASPLGNGSIGVWITLGASSNLVGTNGDGVNDEAERNVISGNTTDGVQIRDTETNDNIVAGNFIGTDVTGNAALGNGENGIRLRSGAQNNLIGTDGDGVSDAAERNVISGNAFVGVLINGATSQFNAIAGNYIGVDSTGAAALPNGTPGEFQSHGIRIAGADNNRIGTDGSNDGFNENERNVISGNLTDGIHVNMAQGTVIAGNYIGTDASGSVGLGNGQRGIRLSQGAHQNRIGTNADGIADAAEGNLISANLTGILLLHDETDENVITGNLIGTDASGSTGLGNQFNGIWIVTFGGEPAGQNNRIGSDGDGLRDHVEVNTIAFNTQAGVMISNDGTTGNTVRGNSIHSNSGLGIDLGGDGVTPNDAGDADTGPNDLQNFPELRAARPGEQTRIVGTLQSMADSVFTVDFYANSEADPSGHGEGERWLGSTLVSTDGDGNGAFTVVLDSKTTSGEWITATATDIQGSTSEFSQAIEVDLIPPEVLELGPVTPDPRNLPVDVIDAVFSEELDLDSLSADDLQLTRNGEDVELFDQPTFEQISETTYRIGNLDFLTGGDGTYTLAVDAGDIQDVAGNAGVGSLQTAWLMDTVDPISGVDALPRRATSLEFEVSVTGSDPALEAVTPSGVESYDLFVSDNGDPFEFWTTVDAENPTALFTAESHNTYGFQSIARDAAGNVEDKPASLEAAITVGDLNPPVTQVDSIDSETPTFVLNISGQDAANSGLDVFEVYVEVDGGPALKIATINAGPADSNGNHQATIAYQAIADGNKHTYRFYTRGIDAAGNVESAPEDASADVIVTATFDVPEATELTSFVVQQGMTQRSFIRHLEASFNQADDLQELLDSLANEGQADRIVLTHYDLEGNVLEVALDPSMIQLVGQTLQFDFGAGGIGGDPSSTIGDGIYRLAFDYDGDGNFEDDQTFHRLLGDVNGNGEVEFDDLNIVYAALGQSGTNLEEDVNANGAVTFDDFFLVYDQLGRMIDWSILDDDE